MAIPSHYYRSQESRGLKEAGVTNDYKGAQKVTNWTKGKILNPVLTSSQDDPIIQ